MCCFICSSDAPPQRRHGRRHRRVHSAPVRHADRPARPGPATGERALRIAKRAGDAKITNPLQNRIRSLSRFRKPKAMDRTFGRELPQRRTARLGRSRPEVQNGRLPSSDSKTGDFEFREFLYNFVNLSPMFHAISTPIRSMTAHMLRHLRQPFFPSGARRRQRRPVSFPKALRLLPCAALLLLAATTRAQERRTTHDDDFRARFSFALTKRLGQRHAITLD